MAKERVGVIRSGRKGARLLLLSERSARALVGTGKFEYATPFIVSAETPDPFPLEDPDPRIEELDVPLPVPEPEDIPLPVEPSDPEPQEVEFAPTASEEPPEPVAEPEGAEPGVEISERTGRPKRRYTRREVAE